MSSPEYNGIAENESVNEPIVQDEEQDVAENESVNEPIVQDEEQDEGAIAENESVNEEPAQNLEWGATNKDASSWNASVSESIQQSLDRNKKILETITGDSVSVQDDRDGARDNDNNNDEESDATKIVGVFGLETSITDEDLMKEFGCHGEIESISLIKDRDTGASRGFAFINFIDVKSAISCQKAANGLEMNGRTIRSDFSQGQNKNRQRSNFRDRDSGRGKDDRRFSGRDSGHRERRDSGHRERRRSRSRSPPRRRDDRERRRSRSPPRRRDDRERRRSRSPPRRRDDKYGSSSYRR